MKRFTKFIPIWTIMIFMICSRVSAQNNTCPDGAECGTCQSSSIYWIKQGNTISFSDKDPDDSYVPYWHNTSCGTNLFKNNSTITKVYIEGPMILTFQDIFYDYIYLEEIHLKNVSSYNTLMTDAFRGCTALTLLEMTNVDISNVEDMYNTFRGCSSLETLDLSSWNTSSLTRTPNMFQDCTNLKNLNLSGWDTSNVTDMSSMFQGCSNLDTITLENSNWKTDLVVYFSYMFSGCSALTDSVLAGFNIENWNTSSAIYMKNLFSGCSSLEVLDLGLWDVSKVSEMREMFSGCSSLKELSIRNWKPKVTGSSKRSIFQNCNQLNTLTLGENSLNNNIFTSSTGNLPKYTATWYYVEADTEIATNPLDIGTTRSNTKLFTAYTPSTMAGTWSTTYVPEYSIKISGVDENCLGDNTYTYDSTNNIYKRTYTPENLPLTLPTAPTKTDWTFAGWSGTGLSDVTKTVTITVDTAGNKEYTAEWVKIPVITGEPEDLSLTYGYTTDNTLTVTAGAAETGHTISYQWYSAKSPYSTEESEEIPNATEASYTIPTGHSAGKEYYYCVVTSTRTDINKSVSVNSRIATVNIGRASVTVSPDKNQSKTYGSEDPILTWSADGLKNGDTKDVLTVEISRTNGEVVGEYTITTDGAPQQGNYDVAYEHGIFTINTAPITISAIEKTKVYDNDASTDPELTAKVHNKPAKGVDPIYSLSREPGQDAGDYTITVNAPAASNPNYTISVTENTFHITQAPITIKADEKTKIYDNDASTDPELTATVIDKPTMGVDPLYSLSREPGQNVGDYAITVTAPVSENPNYTITIESDKTFSITPAAVMVIADNMEKVFGTDDPELTWTAYGLADGDEKSVLKVKIYRETGEAVGDYIITTSGDKEQGNYTVTFNPGTFTIIKADPTVITSPTPNNRIYDATEQPLLNSDGEASGGTLYYALGSDPLNPPADEEFNSSIPTETGPGTFYMWYKIHGDKDHKDSIPVCIFVSILEPVQTISPEIAFTAVYDGEPHGTEVSAAKPAEGAAVKYGTSEGTYDLDASPTITNVSDSPLTVYYQITADGYETLTGSAVITLKKADTCVKVPPKALDRVYDGTEKPLLSDDGEACGGMLYYALGNDDGTPPALENFTTTIPGAADPGTYYACYFSKGDENHNDSDPVCIPVTITKQQPGPKQNYTVTVTTDGHGTASVSLTPAAQSAAILKSAEGTKVSGPTGTIVYLTATPDSGYRFKEWLVEPDTGTLSGNTYTIGNADVVITAIFEKNAGPTPPPAPEPQPWSFFLLGDNELPRTGITSRTGFSRENMPASVNYKPVKMELDIPSLNVTSEIVSVPRTDEGYPIQWLGDDAGLLEGSALPGKGISVIAGHNTLNAEEYGPFALISQLQEGDIIFIRRPDGYLMSFRVYLNEKIEADAAEELRQAAGAYENTLTLLTCEDERAEGGYASRRIVSARLVD